MIETWKPTTSGGHHVRNVRRIGTGWRGEVCLRPGGPRRGEPKDWQTEMWYSDGTYYGASPKSVLDLVAINEAAIMGDIELIKADLESIHGAQRCLESMKSLQGDPHLTFDFQIMWDGLTGLALRLQRKLDRLKNEGGAK